MYKKAHCLVDNLMVTVEYDYEPPYPNSGSDDFGAALICGVMLGEDDLLPVLSESAVTRLEESCLDHYMESRQGDY